MAKPTKIILDKQSDLKLTSPVIVGPSGIVKSDLPGLVDDLSNLESSISEEESRAIAAEASLRDDLDAEIARAIAAEDELDSRIVDIISNTNAPIIDSFTEVVNRIGDEEAARIAGDAQLSSDLADLQSYVDTTVDSAIATLTSDLAAETAARIADVDAEETRAIAAETQLQSNLTLEANERMAEDITLQGNIDSESSRAQLAETAIAADLAAETAARIADVNAEETRAMAAESKLTTDLSFEVTRATSAESVLQDNIDTEKSRIDAILIGASANADNFAEIVALINSVDTTNDTAFASYVLSNDAALAAEISRAEGAEAELTSDLAAEVSRATAAETELTSDLAAEVSRATAAEASLTSALSAEEASRIAGDASLQSSLTNEISDRSAADAQLTSDLAAEVSARIADVNAEETRAIAAETKLTNDLAAEIAAREAAIAEEHAHHTAAEASLQSAIDAEKLRIDAILAGSTADLDQFVEIVNFVNGIDLDNDASLLSAVTQINSDIDAEEAARIAGDAQLSSDLADLQSYVDTTVDSAIATLTSDLASETAARIADVDAEETRAMAAEAELAADLSAEVLAREAAIAEEHAHHIALDSAVNQRIDDEIAARIIDVNAEETRALAAEASLAADIDAEEASRIAGDQTLNNAIVAERDRAIAAESGITLYLSAEVTRATAAETTLTSNLAAEVSARESAITAEETARIAGDQALTTSINTLQSYVDITVNQAIADLNTAIDTEETARVEADNDLRADLDAEVTRATGAEAGLQTQIDTEKGRIDAILAGSDVNLDTFVEVVDFVNSIDLDIEGSILNAVTTINQTIQQEVDRATQSENEISSAVTELSDRLDAAETNLNDLPGVDNSTVEVGPGNVIRLREQVSAPDSGIRTFSGILNMSSEPSNEITFTDLSLVTKQYVFGLFTAEADRAQQVEEGLLNDMSTSISRIEGLESAFNGLPVADETSIHFDEANNVIKLADTIEAGSQGIRTFSGILNMSSEPSNELSFTDLSLVTKQYVFGLFTAEADRAQQVEEGLLNDMTTSISRIEGLESAFNGLPLADETSLHFDEANNVIKLADSIEAGSQGIRTFSGILNMSSEPSNEINFTDLSLVTKQYVFGLFTAEADRAQQVEEGLLDDMSTSISRIENLESAFQGLPLVDGSTLVIDEVNNEMKLANTVAAGASGVRTFEGVIKVGTEPSLDSNFDDLTLVTKGWVETQVGEDVTQLIADLAAETAAREAAIAEEHAHHTATEAALQTAIDAEKLRIDAILAGSTADLDQFIEIVNFVESIDLANDNSLLAAVTQINSDIDAEEAARIAGDAQLSSDLADLQSYVDTTVDSAIATLTSDLASETAARIADVDAEETRAMAAEAVLATDFANVYSKKVTVGGTANGVLTTFTLGLPVRIGSEQIFVNGLLQEIGEDYTTVVTSGKVSAIEFLVAPIADMRVTAYGVCGVWSGQINNA